jgi:nucleotide-binding universal stress UspA family protein
MTPFQTVLCALDFEPGSARALVRAADVAERAGGALHLVHVTPRAQPAGAAEGAFRQRAGRFVDDVLGGSANPAAEVHRAHGAPADGVLRQAAAVGADLVVLGTHGRRGLAHLALGSVAAEVLRRSPVPVLVVPEQAARTAPGPDAPVLVAVDFSAGAALAARLGRDLAGAYGAPVVLAHVRAAAPDTLLRPPSLQRGAERGGSGLSRSEAHAALDRLAERAGLGPPAPEQYVVPGAPVDALAELAGRTGAGVLVVGTHGRSGWDRLRLGSVAEGVVRRTPCPVLVAPSAGGAGGPVEAGADAPDPAPA